ncbi:MAG: 50S ribosomal protein L25 [Candidatus Pacebacteria bacterium]|nr:50S ribosomal protein L25 [Candidatus Paceibacterota bacterium]
MLKIKVNKRKDIKSGVPCVLYGPKIKNTLLEVNLKEFEKIYQQVGESSLISLEMEDNKKSLALIYGVQKNPLTGQVIHVDFYQPVLTEKVEATVPLVFEGISLAVKDLGGTLIKDIQEVEVKALPEKLPHDIKVNIEKLKTFEDEILIKDLILPEGVIVLKEPEEIVANVLPPQDIEAELEKPVEEDVEKVEKVEEKEKQEQEEAEQPQEEPQKEE